MATPARQIALLEQIRQAHLDALDEALDELTDETQRRARIAIERIKRSGYRRSVITSETRAITNATSGRMSQYVAESIRDAAQMAERAADLREAWRIADRIEAFPGEFSESDLGRARAFDGRALVADAEAAIAREKYARLRTTSEQDAAIAEYGATSGYQPTYERTRGVEILMADRRAGNIKEAREIGLSRRLHGAAADNATSTRRAVGRIVREGRSLDRAGRELIREVKGLGGQQALTGPLERLRRAGKALHELGDGDKAAARKEWDRAFRRIKRTAERLADKRGGYAELIQILDKQGPEATNKALSRWLDEKQRYNSERIVETESNAAYREREYQLVRDKRYITHFYWRLNRSGRKGFVRRVKPRRIRRRGAKGKKQRRRCICESLADQRFPIAVAKNYPRGGHPFCRCFFEYVYNTGQAMRARVSEQDLEWFDSLPD